VQYLSREHPPKRPVKRPALRPARSWNSPEFHCNRRDGSTAAMRTGSLGKKPRARTLGVRTLDFVNILLLTLSSMPHRLALWRGSRFPLRSNQLSGVRFAAGCWVQGVPSQSSGPPGPVCLRRFLAAVLRIVRARSGPSSPSVPPGPAPRKFFSGARSSLISSEDFPCLALRVDGTPRAQLRKLRQQPKNNGGRGELAGHHWSPYPPNFSARRTKP
jgi:hypothetical protein